MKNGWNVVSDVIGDTPKPWSLSTHRALPTHCVTVWGAVSGSLDIPVGLWVGDGVDRSCEYISMSMSTVGYIVIIEYRQSDVYSFLFSKLCKFIEKS